MNAYEKTLEWVEARIQAARDERDLYKRAADNARGRHAKATVVERQETLVRQAIQEGIEFEAIRDVLVAIKQVRTS